MKDFLRDIVLAAGAMSLDYRSRLGELEVNHKSRKDLVSEADVALEEYLVAQIKERYPDHAILGGGLSTLSTGRLHLCAGRLIIPYPLVSKKMACLC